MLYTYPGAWYQTYQWRQAGGVETLSFNSARHRVLLACLPDEPNKYGRELLDTDLNPFWQCTEFSVWYPDYLCFWVSQDWMPEIVTMQLEMICDLLSGDHFDEVIVSGRGMTKSATAALTLAKERSIDIANRTAPGSHAYTRVRSIIGAHLTKVA